jgi:hypothetical protein
MIAIAIVAPFMAIGALLADFGWRMEAFYGPRGRLERERLAWSEISFGSESLRVGRPREAEVRFRAALALFEVPEPADWSTPSGLTEALVGLADALALQHRDTEAEPLYRRSLAIRARDDPFAAEVLDRHAALLRRMGRLAEAEGAETSAGSIRAGQAR